MKEKWVILDKSARWWKGCKKPVKWVIKSGEDYWIINGSEFPEKKITKSKNINLLRRRKETSIPFNIKYSLLIFLASVLGISLAINLIFYLMS